MPAQVEAASPGLTICSVGYRARRFLDLNDALVRQLNPESPRPEWLLFDNNVELDEMFNRDDRRFTVVRAETRDLDMGYEHALGISRLLGLVKTRFLLVLDPDCFIVMPDWLRRVPAYMTERGLGFFGTPINQRRHNSYRYFPYMVCMFVDLSRVSRRDLCFLPGVWHWWPNATYRVRKALAGIPNAGLLFRWLLTEQWRTNGWQIKSRFGSGRDVAFECAQPVWDVESAVPHGSVKRVIHALTPGAVSPIPKQPGYCTPRGFASAGAPDVAALGWEEFMWRDQPFAFHVGSGHAFAASSHQAALSTLSSTVDAFARPAPAPTPV
jgi:hypothetical protein